MTERVKKQYDELKKKEYRNARNKDGISIDDAMFEGMSQADKETVIFCKMIRSEEIVLREGDRIGFHRHRQKRPRWFPFGNIVPNYERYLREGFGGVYESLKRNMHKGDEAFARNAMRCIEEVFAYCERLKEKAGEELRAALEVVPYHAPRTYHQALVMMKCIIYTLRLVEIPHVTLGRFDYYMRPFYEADRKRGISREELFELTEEFFISLNYDTDIYAGVQQGDNGQSMVLGGYDADGNDCFSELSEVVMDASMELCLIDPKINLRVSKKTPLERFRYATEMTKLGLGFPQYCNDDIIVPGLIRLGYDVEDAYNYAAAACWENIIPGRSFDIPNFGNVVFPKCVNKAIEKSNGDESFEGLLGLVISCLEENVDAAIDWANSKIEIIVPHPYFSLFIDDCIDLVCDYSEGKMKYFNIGFHGVGISTAADSLAAIKKTVYEDKIFTLSDVKKALEANFEGYEDLRKKLASCPKMGNNDDYVDGFLSFLLDNAEKSLCDKKNIRGGFFRLGTGSAQGYILKAKECGASADGRFSGEPFACSFSPSIGAKIAGPLSVIKSFTKFDLKRVVNGGPLTMEIHENTFRNEDGMMKVAMLVKSYIEMGGHQLQLNSINRERLIEAQKKPEEYQNLIVRVWGWSGYFTELDVEYQNHIISRTVLT